MRPQISPDGNLMAFVKRVRLKSVLYVQDLQTGHVLISSQNHGFAVDESTLPANVRPTHRSLFDGSLQGIELTDAPAFSFQGHPEAAPGPHDVDALFDRFIRMMAENGRDPGPGTRDPGTAR